MKKLLLFFIPFCLYASNEAFQTIEYSVGVIYDITIEEGAIIPLVAAEGSGSSNTFDVSNSELVLGIFSNQPFLSKVTVHSDTEIPAGFILKAEALNPPGTSEGNVVLSTTSQDIISNVGSVSDTARINYSVTASIEAEPFQRKIIYITYTLTPQ